MQFFISKQLSVTSKNISVNGNTLLADDVLKLTAEDVYRQLHINYPKFFKMDMLCKWAVIATEGLLRENNSPEEQSTPSYVYDGMDKTKIAVVLMTAHGCLDVDKKYLHSTETIASPALFVYTLPNIMLGEICIKHGFKGEQLCMLSDTPDTDELFFWVSHLLQYKGMDACVCGWVNAAEERQEAHLVWVNKKNGSTFSKENIAKCIKKIRKN